MTKLQIAREAIEQTTGVEPLHAGDVRRLMEHARSGATVVLD